MPDAPDLTELTSMLIIIPAIVVPQIRLRDRKKTYFLRCAVIFVAVAVWLIAVIPQLKTYPPTDNFIVYVTDTGEKYHAGDCSHLWNSKHPLTLEDAISKGYDDCYHCATPTYRSKSVRVTLRDLYPEQTRDLLWILPLCVVGFYGVLAILVWRAERRRK